MQTLRRLAQNREAARKSRLRKKVGLFCYYVLFFPCYCMINVRINCLLFWLISRFIIFNAFNLPSPGPTKRRRKKTLLSHYLSFFVMNQLIFFILYLSETRYRYCLAYCMFYCFYATRVIYSTRNSGGMLSCIQATINVSLRGKKKHNKCLTCCKSIQIRSHRLE